MTIGENLQHLRARRQMTQEQLAAELEVSRQTISKWESNQSYPEMDKLNTLCELFGCSLDQLVRGSIPTDEAVDEFGYDKLMNTFTWHVTAGVGVIIAAVALFLFLSSNIQPTYAVVVLLLLIFGGVISIIIGSMQQERFRKKHPQIAVFYPEQVLDEFERRFIYYIVGGIGIILAAVLVLVLMLGKISAFDAAVDDIRVLAPVAIFMLMIACGVMLLVYAGMQKEKYDIERYNEMNCPTEEGKSKQKRVDDISGAIMLTATAVFLLLGWLGNLWHVAWVAFPIGGIACAIVGSLFGTER